MFEDLTILEILVKGGIAMTVLVLFSIISVAVMIERAWRFRKFKSDLNADYDTLNRTVRKGGAASAITSIEGRGSALALAYRAASEKAGRDRGEVLHAMEVSARVSVSALERWLGVLGTIGSTAPFVGLFGTVVGIMHAFSDIAQAEGAGFSIVADGVAEALIATAAGLFVAIPAVIAYNYFVRASARLGVALEARACEFVDDFARRGVGE